MNWLTLQNPTLWFGGIYILIFIGVMAITKRAIVAFSIASLFGIYMFSTYQPLVPYAHFILFTLILYFSFGTLSYFIHHITGGGAPS